MTRLQHYAALTESHFALADTVRDLENEWGDGASVPRLMQLVGLTQPRVEAMLGELAEAGLIVWRPNDGVAFDVPGSPLLGEVA